MNTAVLIFLAVAVLAVSLILALLGSRIYENSAADEKQQHTYEALSYFAEQARKCEGSSDMRVASLKGEVPALVLTGSAAQKNSGGDTDESEKEMWYFVYDGSLKKVRTDAGTTVSPEAGTVVMPMESAGFRMLRGDLLEITVVTQDGESASINLSFADGGGGSDE